MRAEVIFRISVSAFNCWKKILWPSFLLEDAELWVLDGSEEEPLGSLCWIKTQVRNPHFGCRDLIPAASPVFFGGDAQVFLVNRGCAAMDEVGSYRQNGETHGGCDALEVWAPPASPL